jgi:hypothetical protein
MVSMTQLLDTVLGTFFMPSSALKADALGQKEGRDE